MVTAIYPGTFDPVTLGHVDIVARAAALFEKVIVTVYSQPSKKLLFNSEERVELFEKAIMHLPNVEIRKFEGLVVRCAEDMNASVIVRGLRSGSRIGLPHRQSFAASRDYCPRRRHLRHLGGNQRQPTSRGDQHWHTAYLWSHRTFGGSVRSGL